MVSKAKRVLPNKNRVGNWCNTIKPLCWPQLHPAGRWRPKGFPGLLLWDRDGQPLSAEVGHGQRLPLLEQTRSFLAFLFSLSTPSSGICAHLLFLLFLSQHTLSSSLIPPSAIHLIPSQQPRFVFLTLFVLLVLLLPTHGIPLATHRSPLRRSISPYTPDTTTYPASNYIDNKAFYILGGSSDGTIERLQLFELDLSTSWTTIQPAFLQLKDELDPRAGFMASALAADEQTWFLLPADGYPQLYNINTGTWSLVTSSQGDPVGAAMGSSLQAGALSAATDPSSGIVYVPNGYTDPDTGLSDLLKYTVGTNTANHSEMHPDLTLLASFSVAWAQNTVDNVGGGGLYVFGGATIASLLVNGGATPDCRNDLYTYDPVADLWTVLQVQQQQSSTILSARRDGCLVPFQNGSKLVLFGGMSDQGAAILGDLYIFDTISKIWTRGQDVATSDVRYGHACAVSNEMLIVWGGSNQYNAPQTTPFTSATLVYDLKAGRWIDTYVPAGSTSPSSPSGLRTSSARQRTMAVVFGLLGAVLIIVVVLYMFNSSLRRFCQQKSGRGRQQKGGGLNDQKHQSEIDSLNGDVGRPSTPLPAYCRPSRKGDPICSQSSPEDSPVDPASSENLLTRSQGLSASGVID